MYNILNASTLPVTDSKTFTYISLQANSLFKSSRVQKLPVDFAPAHGLSCKPPPPSPPLKFQTNTLAVISYNESNSDLT